jgi:hypothetical protein
LLCISMKMVWLDQRRTVKDNLKSLHKTIKKVAEDIEGFSSILRFSQFMICVNELLTQNCPLRYLRAISDCDFALCTTHCWGIVVLLLKWRFYCTGSLIFFDPKHL